MNKGRRQNNVKKDKEFKARIKTADLIKQERKRVLWACLDILFANDEEQNKNSLNVQKNYNDDKRNN